MPMSLILCIIFTFILLVMIKSIRPGNWVSCPLGMNHLLSLITGNKAETEKYYQIGCQLQRKGECYFRSKLFAKSSNKMGEAFSDTEITDDPLKAFTQWTEKNMTTKNKIQILESDFFLVNISTFKGSWNTLKDGGALMKIYNTFNYTQDVKYEARLLELPMQNNFRFIIIVPNEGDVLQSLFQRFSHEGLAAALKGIQPVFVVCSEINAPSIKIEAEITLKGVTTDNVHLAQYGYINVNDTGAHIEVLSCIFTAHSNNKHDSLLSSSPFFFGLVHEDMAIFIGQYFPVQ